MTDDLDQSVLLIASILAAISGLILLLTWVEGRLHRPAHRSRRPR